MSSSDDEVRQSVLIPLSLHRNGNRAGHLNRYQTIRNAMNNFIERHSDTFSQAELEEASRRLFALYKYSGGGEAGFDAAIAARTAMIEALQQNGELVMTVEVAASISVENAQDGDEFEENGELAITQSLSLF